MFALRLDDAAKGFEDDWRRGLAKTIGKPAGGRASPRDPSTARPYAGLGAARDFLNKQLHGLNVSVGRDERLC